MSAKKQGRKRKERKAASESFNTLAASTTVKPNVATKAVWRSSELGAFVYAFRLSCQRVCANVQNSARSNRGLKPSAGCWHLGAQRQTSRLESSLLLRAHVVLPSQSVVCSAFILFCTSNALLCALFVSSCVSCALMAFSLSLIAAPRFLLLILAAPSAVATRHPLSGENSHLRLRYIARKLSPSISRAWVCLLRGLAVSSPA